MAITAVYKNGVFVPTGKVDLAEEALVSVEPLSQPAEGTDSSEDNQKFLEDLRAMGWGQGHVLWISEDFDDPLPEFEEYM